jgi:tetratricopeptide (TPR) repeat protein
MTRKRPGDASPRMRISVIISALWITILALLATGCEELDARREIKAGNKLYERGDYRGAAEAFEAGLKLGPDLEIGHHNVGLAYYKLFQSAPDKDAARGFADKAAEHLGVYLKKHPADRPIIDLISRIWLDSGQYDKALAYWEGELQKDPKNTELLGLMAGINRQAGRWEESMRWHQREADASAEPGGKITAYLSIARLALNKLMNREKIVGVERQKIADYGVAAMLLAQPLQPSGPEAASTVKAQEIVSYLRALYEFRGMAHGPRWAWAVDAASNQKYNRTWVDLDKMIKKDQPPATVPGTPPATAPAAPSPSGPSMDKNGG